MATSITGKLCFVIMISTKLESAMKPATVIQNEFKQPNEAVSKTEQKTSSRNQLRVQSVLDVTIYTIYSRIQTIIYIGNLIQNPSHQLPSLLIADHTLPTEVDT